MGLLRWGNSTSGAAKGLGLGIGKILRFAQNDRYGARSSE
jgi:hypothetical protein